MRKGTAGLRGGRSGGGISWGEGGGGCPSNPNIPADSFTPTQHPVTRNMVIPGPARVSHTDIYVFAPTA